MSSVAWGGGVCTACLGQVSHLSAHPREPILAGRRLKCLAAPREESLGAAEMPRPSRLLFLCAGRALNCSTGEA